MQSLSNTPLAPLICSAFIAKQKKLNDSNLMNKKCLNCNNPITDKDEFCRVCIAPVSVPKISEFGMQEHASLLMGLLSAINKSKIFDDKSLKWPHLKEYLNSFWLRPESAMYMAAEYSALCQLNNGNRIDINVDIGCGDGIHTSILNGWKFRHEFDAFGNIDLESRDIFDAKPI